MECAFELMHSIAVTVQPLITDTLATVCCCTNPCKGLGGQDSSERKTWSKLSRGGLVLIAYLVCSTNREIASARNLN